MVTRSDMSGPNNYHSQIDINAAIHRSREILLSEGLHSLWLKFLGETVYRRMDVFEREISPAAAQFELPEGLEINLLQVSEVDEFVEFRALHDRETILRRLERGQTCFLVRNQGQIIHNAWTAKGSARIDYLACDIQLAGDTIYVFEAYTAEAWRGKSISSLRRAVMETHCRGQGFQRLLGVVWPESAPAVRNVEKAGYQRVGRIGYLGAGRFRKYFCRYEKNDPAFRLNPKSSHGPSIQNEPFWDGVPGRVDAQSHYLDSFLAQVKRRENLRLVMEWGDISPDSRLLKTDAFEEAMGEDSFLTDLVKLTEHITAIDVSPAIAARAYSRHHETALTFLAADVRRLPFSDASFSVVTSPSTLDHFPDPDDLGVSLRELFRVMEPGGRLVITLDNRQNFFDSLLQLVHKLGLVPYYLGRSYTVNELRSELRNAGFEVKETTAILHNPRLVAVATMRFTRWLGWRWLIRSVQNGFLTAQKLERSPLCYYTGSFVAALAMRPERSGSVDSPA